MTKNYYLNLYWDNKNILPCTCIPYSLLYSKILPLNFLFGVEFFFFPIQFSCSVVFESLPPHEQRHTKLPCPSPDPGVWISFLWCWIYFFTCLIHLFQMPVFYSHTSHLNNFHQELYASTILYIWTFSQSIISPLSPNFAYVLNSTQNSFLYLKLPD